MPNRLFSKLLGKKLIKNLYLRRGNCILGSRTYFERKDEDHRKMVFKATWIYVKLIQSFFDKIKKHSRPSLPPGLLIWCIWTSLTHIIQFHKWKYGHWARVRQELSSGELSGKCVVWGKIRQDRNHNGVPQQLVQGMFSFNFLISDVAKPELHCLWVPLSIWKKTELW